MGGWQGCRQHQVRVLRRCRFGSASAVVVCVVGRVGFPGSQLRRRERGSAEPKAERDASTCVTALARASPAPQVARPLCLVFGNALGPCSIRKFGESVARLSRDPKIQQQGIFISWSAVRLIGFVAVSCRGNGKRNHLRIAFVVCRAGAAREVCREGPVARLLVNLDRGLRRVRSGAGPRRLSQVLIPAHVVV